MRSPAGIDRRQLLGTAGGTARLMFYALLAVVLMVLDYRGQYVPRVHEFAVRVVEPVMLAVDLPFAVSRNLTRTWADRRAMAERMRELERVTLEQRADLERTHDLERENATLRALLGAARRVDHRFVAAELASVDLDPFAHRIVVKRGRIHGVDAGMPVVDDHGVLGQVEQAARRTARVILLTDPDHALPVQILATGERTIAYGSGSVDRLRLTDLPMNAELAPGDLVVTSGLGGRFPPGLPVGTVAAVTRQPGQPFATAEVRPLAAMDRNRLVLVLAPESDETTPQPEAPPPDAAADEEAGVAGEEIDAGRRTGTDGEPDGDDREPGR
ncbi:MAG: rod shape-determining protein MreC [Wenzhouxiangellaceae bacterium]|nr:rod shape-determining protein MreC [Wenzhouxiangellaceae bacterium]